MSPSPSPATARLSHPPRPRSGARARPDTVSAPVRAADGAGGWPLLRACRPRQWLKNAVVVIAPATAGTLSRAGTTSALLSAFGAFCLMSSATYLVNDVHDRDSDQRHVLHDLGLIALGLAWTLVFTLGIYDAG